ncbi:MAG: DNA cytosine methyltransferase [Chloroflexota bacterium]
MAHLAVDLFAGAGGATAGLKAAGIRVVAAVENNADAAASYRLNHPEVVLLAEDIRRVSPTRLMRCAGLSRGALSLLQACPPCQTWSSLGTRSENDPRNELLSLVGRFIRVMRPKAFIIENVRGLQSDARLDLLLAMTREIGYVSKIYLVDASAFAVPQRRKRLIVIGVRGVEETRLRDDIVQMLPEGYERTPRTVEEAIGHLASVTKDADPLQVSRALTDLALRRVKAIPPGGRRSDLPADLELECHKTAGTKGATSSYGRMSADAVAPTLTTRCTTVACGAFIHPSQDRGITLREAALLQTFDKDYRFSGGYDSIERQIGNAIPVLLARAAATAALGLMTKPVRP